METKPKPLPESADIKQLSLDYIARLAFAKVSKPELPPTPEAYVTAFFENFDAHYAQVVEEFEKQNNQRFQNQTWVREPVSKR